MKPMAFSAGRLHGPVRRTAFTLVELLTVVALVGILAAILIPVVGEVRSNARLSTCTSNFHQIGLGIQLYANDHKGRLPGGLNEGQGPFYKGESSGALVSFIGPYIDASDYKSGVSLKSRLFTCPAWDALFPGATSGVCYAMNMSVSLDGGATRVEPFGRAVSGKRPVLLNQITDPLSTTPAMVELDKKNNKSTGLTGQAADWAPVHGGVRNVLYFDGRVASVPVP